MNSDDKKTSYSQKEIENIINDNKKLSDQVKRLVRTEYDLFNTQLELDTQLSLYRELYDTGKRISSMKDFSGVFAEMGTFIIDSLNFGGYLLLEKQPDSFKILLKGGCCEEYEDTQSTNTKLPLTEELFVQMNNPGSFFATELTMSPLLCKNIQSLCLFKSFVAHFLFLGNEKEPTFLLIVGNPPEDEYFTKIKLDSGHMISLGNLISLVETVLNNNLYYQQLKEERKMLEIKVHQRTNELNKAMNDLKILNDKLEIYSFQDDLTGLYNRRGFFVFGEQFFQMALRQNKQVIILYCDLDKFKPINDRYGHKEGDLALQETARLLKSACRNYDIISRFGGDEFVIMFDNFTVDNFEKFLIRFKKLFDDYNKNSGKKYDILISYGYTVYDPSKASEISLDTLIERADKKLYQEKHRKRENDIEN